MTRFWINFSLSFATGAALACIVQEAHGATITTATQAITKPTYGSPQPDCFVSNPNSAVCNFAGAGADASASAWFDEAHSQGGVHIATFADRSNGSENAIASATAMLDAWFDPMATGTIRAVFSYSLGPSWGYPPNLVILLNGAEQDYHQAGSGEVSMLTQVVLGTPFEVLISLTGRASAPGGNGSGTAQLFQLFQEMDVMSDTMPRQMEKQVFLADPPAPSLARIPEPGTFVMLATVGIGWLLLERAKKYV